MNCTQAREILNILIDGEQHPRTDEVRRHLAGCADCAEWHADIERSLLLLESIRDDIPEVDISAAVTASLPSRHPASRRSSERSRLRLILAWLAASWLAGLLMLSVLGVAIYGWMVSLLTGRNVVDAVGYVKTTSGVLGTVTSPVRSLVDLAMRVIADVSPAILSLIALDALFLVAVFAVFFGRRKVTGTPGLFC